MRWIIAQWFEKQWWKHYLANKTPAEYAAWKQNYWHNFLLKIRLQFDEPLEILDAGCGPAGIFSVLSGHKVNAIDPLIELYEQQLPHFARENFPHVTFHNATIESLQFNSEYDVVFCLNAINHVSSIDKAYDALIKAVKPGGKLILSIDSHNTKIIKWLFRILPLDILHPHQFALAEYANALTDRGIVIKQIDRIKPGFLFDYYTIVGEKT